MDTRSGRVSRLQAVDLLTSVVATQSRAGLRQVAYTPFGHAPPGNDARTAFAGQWRERKGLYLLGNGYRLYFPTLMRFSQADSYSPFGEGGPNAYAYCGAQPVSQRDPSGRYTWLIGAGLLGAAGIVTGFLAWQARDDKRSAMLLGGISLLLVAMAVGIGAKQVLQRRRMGLQAQRQAVAAAPPPRYSLALRPEYDPGRLPTYNEVIEMQSLATRPGVR